MRVMNHFNYSQSSLRSQRRVRARACVCVADKLNIMEQKPQISNQF